MERIHTAAHCRQGRELGVDAEMRMWRSGAQPAGSGVAAAGAPMAKRRGRVSVAGGGEQLQRGVGGGGRREEMHPLLEKGDFGWVTHTL